MLRCVDDARMIATWAYAIIIARRSRHRSLSPVITNELDRPCHIDQSNVRPWTQVKNMAASVASRGMGALQRGMVGAAEQLEAFAGNGPGGASQGLGHVDVGRRRGVITCIRCGAPATNFCSACGART